MRRHPAIVTAAILLFALANPRAWAAVYDLSGDWGADPSVWAYGPGWDKETSSSPGDWDLGDVVVNLGAWPDGGMVTWTCPADGSMTISGAAWATTNSNHDNVYLQYVPAALAGTLDFADCGTALRMGTTSFANGTVQAGYSSIDNKSGFGSASIPLREVSSLDDLPVQAGDVVALVVDNMYMYAGNSVGTQLTIDLTPTPEPTTIFLLAAGWAALSRRR